MKYIFLILLSPFFFIRCVEKAKIEMPKAENKLVLTSFISPGDTVVTATLRLSNPKFDTGINNGVFADDIKNATLVLSDGTSYITIPWQPAMGYYAVNLGQSKITSGKTYYLTATTPDGKKVTASTTVPAEQLNLEAIEIFKKKDEPGTMEYDIAIVATDIPNQLNYVAIGIQNLFAVKSASTTSVNPTDTTDQGGGTLSFFDSDEKFAKNKYYYRTSVFNSPGDKITYAEVIVEALNCSREFYLYHQSAYLASGTQGNPFSDPILVYSNVSGGFGCFGAFTRTLQKRRIR